MKVKKITKRGEEVWLVDGKINGKRKRMFFETEPKAKAWLAAEAKDEVLNELTRLNESNFGLDTSAGRTKDDLQDVVASSSADSD